MEGHAEAEKKPLYPVEGSEECKEEVIEGAFIEALPEKQDIDDASFSSSSSSSLNHHTWPLSGKVPPLTLSPTRAGTLSGSPTKG